MKKSIKFLLTAFALTTALGVCVACGGGGSVSAPAPQIEFQTADGYIQWKYEDAEEWNNLVALEDLKGEKGETGENGATGSSGQDGLSTYQIAVKNGFKGTEKEWLEALKGANGANGKSAYEIAKENGYKGTEKEWIASLKGETGLSAYDIAVKNGFDGTEEEWLESLKGQNGTNAETSENMEGNGTDGLSFQAIIREGIAGYEVIGYDGKETEVVIPNKIFGQSVISIRQDALPNKITSLKISKNTEYLCDFEDYTNLRSFDFNNAPVEKIPANMFYDTALKEVKNYGQVREIGDYAFRNTALIDFDFSKIESIGTYAFYDVDWFEAVDSDEEILEFLENNDMFLYIPESVTKIGANAFSDNDELPVYFENDTAVDYSGYHFYKNVKRTEDGYYYCDKGNYASLLNYDGEKTALTVPEKLGGLSVKSVEDLAFCWNGRVQRVELPSTVLEIGEGAFACTTKMNALFIPDSVTACGDEFAYALDDVYGVEVPAIFFEATEFDYGDFTSTDVIGAGKYYMGITPEDILEDKQCLYLKKLLSFEVVSIKNVAGLVKIPSTINGLPVTKIGSYALTDYGSGVSRVTAVDIPSTVTKIGSKAFCRISSLLAVNVPSSVEDINNYGFYSVGNCTVYIEKSSIPADWDSSWYYSIDGYKLNSKMAYSQENDYVYETVDGKVYLVKYLGTIKAGDTVIVPTKIDGKSVYGVRGYCYQSNVTNSSSNRINIVVDKSITVMESYAFYFNNSYTYVNLYVGYTSSDGRPTDWNSSWIYQYYSSSSYCTYYYANQWEIKDGVLIQK